MKWIISPRTDITFFILAALSGYALLSANLFLGVPSMLIWWFWNVSMNGPHFFATISRTYLDREEWRQRPGLLLASPLLVAIGPLAIWSSLQLGNKLPFQLFTIQLTVWAYYHVVRQHYGFLALYHKANGEHQTPTGRRDYWIFHTVMFAPALIWFVRDPSLHQALGGSRTVIVAAEWALGVAIVVALGALVAQSAKSLRADNLNVPKLLLFAAYVPLHLVVFLYRPVADRYDPYLTNAVITYPHNIQYMAIVWFYARNRYRGSARTQYGPAALVHRSLATFLGVAFAYGAAYYYLDWYLEGLDLPGVPDAFSFSRTPLAHEGGPTVADLVASIWVGFAFHHYYLDQKIWRISRDKRLVKDLRLPSEAPDGRERR